jgi:hypothetical protein
MRGENNMEMKVIELSFEERNELMCLLPTRRLFDKIRIALCYDEKTNIYGVLKCRNEFKKTNFDSLEFLTLRDLENVSHQDLLKVEESISGKNVIIPLESFHKLNSSSFRNIPEKLAIP